MRRATQSLGGTRLAYHKRAQAHLGTGKYSTLFVLCADAKPHTWQRLKTLSDRFPYVGYLPNDQGELPASNSIVFPTGAIECLLIDHLDLLTRDDCMALARGADRSGMRPFCVSQRSGYWRIGGRAHE